MYLTNEFVQRELARAQQLLWGGSETENIEAHNIVAALLVDLEKAGNRAYGLN
jgi:hypothetical protein